MITINERTQLRFEERYIKNIPITKKNIIFLFILEHKIFFGPISHLTLLSGFKQLAKKIEGELLKKI